MRSRRLLAPIGVVGLIAVGTAVPHLTSASAATPDLPAISAQDLLVKVQQAKVAGLSGSVTFTEDLGLPSISAVTSGDGQSVSGGAFDPTTLLTNPSTTFQVAEAGDSEMRLSLAPSSVSEVDVVRNGDQVWTSDSSTQKVTHYISSPGSHAGAPEAAPEGTPPTPQQAAASFLSSISPTTDVSVVTPVYVAGRPTYELRLAPKAADSTVQAVTIAVDSATGVPLQVQVTPKGSTTPALTLGFSSISFAVPSASTFAPLVGTSEVTKVVDGDHGAEHADVSGGDQGGRPATTGTGWGTVASFHTSSLTGRNAEELDAVSSAVTLPGGGTARLVTTRLLNALVLPDGTVVAGFVTPTALEAAAASAG